MKGEFLWCLGTVLRVFSLKAALTLMYTTLKNTPATRTTTANTSVGNVANVRVDGSGESSVSREYLPFVYFVL